MAQTFTVCVGEKHVIRRWCIFQHKTLQAAAQDCNSSCN